MLASYIPYIVELCACEAKWSWGSCTSGERLEGAAPRRSRWFKPSRGGRCTAMGTESCCSSERGGGDAQRRGGKARSGTNPSPPATPPYGTSLLPPSVGKEYLDDTRAYIFLFVHALIGMIRDDEYWV